jgi:hypothetical protein
MAQYTITENDQMELMDIPNKIFPKDSLVQIRTFPIGVINDGVAQGLEPEVIGNNVYDALCNLTMRKFTDTMQPDSIKDYAKFIQAAVQTKLNACIVPVTP